MITVDFRPSNNVKTITLYLLFIVPNIQITLSIRHKLETGLEMVALLVRYQQVGRMCMLSLSAIQLLATVI